MKKILIHSETGELINLNDDDESPLNEYTRNLSSSMKSKNIIILETTDKAVILRPHTINAIEVVEEESILDIIPEINEQVDTKPKKKDEQIDIVTDYDDE